MDGITDPMDMSLSKLRVIVKEKEAWRAAVQELPRVRHDLATEQQQVHKFISGLSILFHWPIFLFFCQYHTVLMTVAFQYNLKSGKLILPAPFFFLKIALAIRGFFLYFHTNCETICSSSVKIPSVA